jgi:hypothetical protein
MLFLADLISEMMFPHVYRIKHLDTYDLAHYAIYEKNQLVQVVILNTHLYTDTTTARPVRYLDVPPLFGSKCNVRRLTSKSSSAKDGVTWPGQAVDNMGRVVGELVLERATCGIVVLQASEAVITEKS